MTNREMLADLGVQVHKIRGNSGKTTCPKCSHTRKKKTDPCLSVNIEKGAYHCHNCGWEGYVAEKSKFDRLEKKEYIKPVFVNNTDLTENMVNFFFKRGISQKTISRMKITKGSMWNREKNENENCINFNYFRDGELINVKSRGANKKFMMVKGAEMIFYNLDSIKGQKTVIVTEGEMDALAFVECGIESVVSVPNGATMSDNPNLEYLDNCISHFDEAEEIILATDQDEPGIKLREELARRFGYHRCYKVDFGDQKDGNDYLMKYGPEKLKETVDSKNIKPFPLAGIVNVDDVFDEVKMLIKGGGLKRGLTLGIKGLDELISWVTGQLTVVTGIPNHGKSPFVLQIMLLLSIRHGWKWGIFSPEHQPISMYLVKIIETICGKMSRTGRITDYELELAHDFIKKHFFFIAPEDSDHKLGNILEKAKSLVVRYGISGLVIDPWNKLEYDQPPGISETNFVSMQLDKIIEFDRSYGVHTIVVAHPTKGRKKSTAEDSEYVVPDLTDISGSANWHNKPDNGIIFYRNYSEKRNEVYVKKVKWEHLGRVGHVYLKYNVNNSRFNALSEDYDNSNWLIPNLPQPEIFDAITENNTNFDNTPPDMEDSPF